MPSRVLDLVIKNVVNVSPHFFFLSASFILVQDALVIRSLGVLGDLTASIGVSGVDGHALRDRIRVKRDEIRRHLSHPPPPTSGSSLRGGSSKSDPLSELRPRFESLRREVEAKCARHPLPAAAFSPAALLLPPPLPDAQAWVVVDSADNSCRRSSGSCSVDGGDDGLVGGVVGGIAPHPREDSASNRPQLFPAKAAKEALGSSAGAGGRAAASWLGFMSCFRPSAVAVIGE